MTAQPTPRADELDRTLDDAIFAVTVSGNHGDPLLDAFAAIDRYLTAARATGDNTYDVLDATPPPPGAQRGHHP